MPKRVWKGLWMPRYLKQTRSRDLHRYLPLWSRLVWGIECAHLFEWNSSRIYKKCLNNCSRLVYGIENDFLSKTGLPKSCGFSSTIITTLGPSTSIQILFLLSYYDLLALNSRYYPCFEVETQSGLLRLFNPTPHFIFPLTNLIYNKPIL